MPKYFNRFGKYSWITNSKIRKPKVYTNVNTKKSKDFYQFAIIDPGSSSCAVRIEKCNFKTGNKKLIWFSIISFGKTTMDINENMSDAFKYVYPYLIKCHHIGVENQLMKSEIDYQCFSAMMYYISSNICTKGNRPNLFGIDVKLKTTYIGGPTTSKQNGGKSIKLWSQKKAKKTCLEENDLISYNILKMSYAKAFQDLCDTKCYCIAWVKYVCEEEILSLPFDKKLLEKFNC